MFNRRKTMHSRNHVLINTKGNNIMQKIGNLPIIRKAPIQNESDASVMAVGSGLNSVSLNSRYVRPVLSQSNLIRTPFTGDINNEVINGKGMIKKTLPMDLRRKGNRNNIKLIL